jgi:predicted signal transduction protein with EAL and GGDEF domain
VLFRSELLQAVSQRLKEMLRESDTLARVGGDEFLLLLPGLVNPEASELVASKLVRELEKPFQVAEHQLYVTASIGVALAPRDGATGDTLIRKADAAMYAAKSGGRHGYRLFTPEMESGPQRRLTLSNDLFMAIDAGQLRLHYQPQVDVRSGCITGVEALVRWQHPRHGLLPPIEFLPIAEESGLSGAIGQWVLETACSDLQRWRAMGADLRLAINFSPSQVEQPDFVPLILSTLQQSRLDTQCLEVELTEESTIKDVSTVVSKLARLADAGVRVAIDDFGIGYSSLSYLRKLPIHTLKIDRSFVQDIRSERDPGSLVSAIVSMADGLKLHTIAEGVETEAQMRFLHALGCHEMQGFLFSRAVDADTTMDLLRTQPLYRMAH